MRVNDWTLLHKVAQFGDESLNHECLEFVKENFNQEEQREIFLQEGKEGVVPIQKTLENENPGVVEKVGAFYLDLFTIDELAQIHFQMKKQEPQYRNHDEKKEKLREILEKQWKIH